jgi:hypothetical protein
MGSSYYQFCPAAGAMELPDERWTLLIARAGHRQPALQPVRRGVPQMSPTLLSKLLAQPARAA